MASDHHAETEQADPVAGGSIDLVLGVDASTPPSSLALVRSSGTATETTGPFGRETDGWIIAAIDRVFGETGDRSDDVDVIVTTVGPGTFTGVRVGIATALGLSIGSGTPAVGIDTLLAIAGSIAAPPDAPVLACIDARRGEIYASWFDTAPTSLTCEPRWGPEVLDPDTLVRRATAGDRPYAVGSGVAVVDALEGLVDVAEPQMSVAAAAARMVLATDAGIVRSMPLPRPQYLRRPDARPGQNPLTRASSGTPAAL